MAIFNSYISLPEGLTDAFSWLPSWRHQATGSADRAGGHGIGLERWMGFFSIPKS